MAGCPGNIKTVAFGSSYFLTPSAVLAFEDYYDGHMRINIFGHGSTSFFREGSVIAIEENGKTIYLNGYQLASKLISKGIIFNNYKTARILSCYSGNGQEGKRLIDEFSQASGLPTKGYYNTLAMNGSLTKYMHHPGFESRNNLISTLRCLQNGQNDLSSVLMISKNRYPYNAPLWVRIIGYFIDIIGVFGTMPNYEPRWSIGYNKGFNFLSAIDHDILNI